MSTEARTTDPDPAAAGRDAGPLGDLPRLSRLATRLRRRLGPGGPATAAGLFADLGRLVGGAIAGDRFDVEHRAAGLKRPGVVAQLAWPRLGSRVALGVDPPLAHALVDRLLGYERAPAEARLQVSPVEWGVLGFVLARGLDRLEAGAGPLGPWDLVVDRVGPDSFDVAGLGPILTYRWRIVAGTTVGTARLWVPESLVVAWLDRAEDEPAPACTLGRFGDLASAWRVEAGRVTLGAAEVADLVAPGRLLLLDDAPLGGTVASPAGVVSLVQADRAGRRVARARVEPGSTGDRIVLVSTPRRLPTPREPIMAAAEPADPDAANPPAPPGAPVEVTVTLTVELGRVNLPLARLAELQPGDVLELGRHGREPVDLTSNGRLVARGELVQVDAELGVRISQVFF